MIRAILFCIFCQVSFGARSWIVSTNGSGINGTVASPMGLSNALSATSPVRAGDTILVRGGIYNGSFVSVLSSPSNNPIVIRAYRSERPIFNCTNVVDESFSFEGSGTWLMGVEITHQNTNRLAVTGVGVGFNSGIGGLGNKLINCVVHDNGVGSFVSSQSTNAEIAGCLIYNNGYQTDDTSHGHGIYAQNFAGTRQLFHHNVIFNQFSLGIQIYGVAGNLDDIDLYSNVIFNNGILRTPPVNNTGILILSAVPSSGIRIVNNITWASAPSPGLYAGDTSPNNSITIQSNVFAATGVQIYSYTNMVWLDNIITSGQVVDWRLPETAQSYVWNRTHYWNTSGFCVCPAGVCKTFSQWRSLYPAFDIDGELLSNPTGQWSFVRANPYDADRSNVIVVNWSSSDNVNVDVSSVLNAGKYFEVRNACDYYGGIVKSGLYAGGNISFPMTNLTVSAPNGMSAPAVTGPAFNVFVLNQTTPLTVIAGSVTNLTIQ